MALQIFNRQFSIKQLLIVLILLFANPLLTDAHKINGYKYLYIKETGNIYGIEENITNFFKKLGFDIISEDDITKMNPIDQSKVIIADYDWNIVNGGASVLNLYLKNVSGNEVFVSSGTGMSLSAKGDMRNAFKKIAKAITGLKYSYDPNLNNGLILENRTLANSANTQPVQNTYENNNMYVPFSDVDKDIPNCPINNENSFVIIITNENYQEEAIVDFALNDGESFKTYCHKVLGIPEKNIHIRKNATKNNMISEISWAQQVAKAYNGSAKFFVYYAGHGVPDEKTGTAYLLPVDGRASMLETGYSLSQFYKELGQMPSAGITVFMDACFSGSKRGDGMLASARGVAIKAKPLAPQGNMVVFSAAQGDETAYPFKEQGHGLFTYYLLKKLKESKGNVSYEELGSYITEKVSRESIVSNGKSQTPNVSASQNSSNWKNLKIK